MGRWRCCESSSYLEFASRNMNATCQDCGIVPSIFFIYVQLLNTSPGASYHGANAVERHAVDQQVSQGAVQHHGRQEPVPLPLLRDRRRQLQWAVWAQEWVETTDQVPTTSKQRRKRDTAA